MKLTSDERASLVPLAEKFATFRRERPSRRSPIPRSLWDEVVAMTADLPPAPVARFLKIDLGNLKSHVARNVQSKSKAGGKLKSRDAVRVAPVVFSGAPTSGVPALEVTRADGSRLSLQSVTPDIIGIVMSQFLVGTRGMA